MKFDKLLKTIFEDYNSEEASRRSALASFLDIPLDEIEVIGDNEYSADGGEYLVLTDEEADKLAAKRIKDDIWAFNAEFIADECGINHGDVVESLQNMQEKCSENANDFLKAAIESMCGLETFIEDAIAADGRGQFISYYDGEENEEGEFFIYRTN